MGFNMASRSERVTAWSICGTILISIALILIIIASAVPYWQERAEGRDTGFPNTGIWEICFDEVKGDVAPRIAQDILGKRYYGCNYVFNRELRTILHWYFPGW